MNIKSKAMLLYLTLMLLSNIPAVSIAQVTEYGYPNFKEAKELVASLLHEESPSVKQAYTVQDYMTMDMRTSSGLYGYELDKMLQDTAMYGLGNYLESKEAEHHVNAQYVIAICGQEQSFGNATSATSKKNNIASLNAVDGNVSAAYSYDSLEECLDELFRLLDEEYLNTSGAYFNGYTIQDVNEEFASDEYWARDVCRIMVKLDKKLTDEEVQ